MAEDTAVRRLMAFLFDYEQVRRPVRSLSGGERTRLAFLLLMEDAPNCLLLGAADAYEGGWSANLARV